MKKVLVSSLGLTASGLCFVHCLAMMIIPALGAHIPAGYEWLEPVFWLVAVATAVFHAWNTNQASVRWGFLLLTAVGTVAIAAHFHDVLCACFWGMAAGNAYMLSKHLRRKNDLKIIVLTGTLASGKTTLLIAILKWMRDQGMQLPPVIVNDRGEGSNLDWHRVTREVKGVDATDLLGECIGCGGRESFLARVKALQKKGHAFIIVEPTGLFTLTELPAIDTLLPGCSVRSIHLIPQPKIQAAISLGFQNLERCRVIGLTHVLGGVEAQRELLQSATGKRVIVLEKDTRDQQIQGIWDLLTEDQGHHCHHCNHDHHSDACHHGQHAHKHHHHDGDPVTTTFSTEGWTMANILGYLLSLGNNLVRFKGVIQGESGLIELEWMFGSWGEPREALPGTPLNAHLFTTQQVDEPHLTDLTDGNVEMLMDGIPSVLIESPVGGHSRLNPVGKAAYKLLYAGSKSASLRVRQKCGVHLVERCRKAANHLLDSDTSGRIDPGLLDYVRVQTVMVWLWWNEEFGFPLSDEDREMLSRVIDQLNPLTVDRAQLAEWIWDGGPDFKALLLAEWPKQSAIWDKLF